MCHLSARADTAYDNAYHHKLRGRIWRGLADTRFDEMHERDEPPGFVMSNPFPPRDMVEGDERKLLVASHDEELLAHVAADLLDDRELNIGEMPFHVDRVTTIETDVGEPGTRGTIETGTGILVRIPPSKCDEYGIESDGEHPTFWKEGHTLEPLKTQLENNLDRKHGLFSPHDLPGPSNRPGELFDRYEFLKSFAIPVTVSHGVEMTYILSKWRFGYEVEDDHHRRHLNLTLDVGIGEKNALGFGFLNIDRDSVVTPAEAAMQGVTR